MPNSLNLATCTFSTTDTTARGNPIWRTYVGGERYDFDFELCAPALGWAQWDTDQDASYFGIWVHRAARRIVTFAEGDLSLVVCTDNERFAAELASMEAFYGAPRPAVVVLDLDEGTRTEVFAQRLGPADITGVAS